jgi:hypothetical protein
MAYLYNLGNEFKQREQNRLKAASCFRKYLKVASKDDIEYPATIIEMERLEKLD